MAITITIISITRDGTSLRRTARHGGRCCTRVLLPRASGRDHPPLRLPPLLRWRARSRRVHAPSRRWPNLTPCMQPTRGSNRFLRWQAQLLPVPHVRNGRLPQLSWRCWRRRRSSARQRPAFTLGRAAVLGRLQLMPKERLTLHELIFFATVVAQAPIFDPSPTVR